MKDTRLISSKNLRVVRRARAVCIYNSLFGNLLKTTQKTVDLIHFFKDGNDVANAQSRFGTDVATQIEGLRKRIFLVENDQYERELLRSQIAEIEKRIRTGGLLYKLQLIATNECNLACIYCYRSNSIVPLLGEKPGKMDSEIAKKVLDRFLSITQRNGTEEVYVRFFGGEPLLNWKLVTDVVEYVDGLDIARPKINYVFDTNGIGITDSSASFLSERGFNVNLSLDGVREINDKVRKYPSAEGTFNEIDVAIDTLMRYGNSITVNATLVDTNLYHIRELIDYISGKGLDNVNLDPCYSRSNLLTASRREKVEQLIDARIYGKERGIKVGGRCFSFYERTSQTFLSFCKRMGEQLSVEPSGDIYPCSGWPLKIGSIENIDAVLSSDGYRRVALRLVGNLPQCYGCEIEGMCAGGCAGNVHILTGDCYNAERDECGFRRALTRRLILIEGLQETKGSGR